MTETMAAEQTGTSIHLGIIRQVRNLARDSGSIIGAGPSGVFSALLRLPSNGPASPAAPGNGSARASGLVLDAFEIHIK
ncbi:hypothetical protein PGTUg99_022898 [Puccinia graminis f. sp. tritici]|uniref:Uncharacterized protein n=1 Tax=Puccinia graminis f. sp. tritici TaxID=56615 RepID=A0A5B0N508_PUCGR|nr:hypothetical protein PGTUg99_022898 [Puccinia graminis f. sp. tritici]